MSEGSGGPWTSGVRIPAQPHDVNESPAPADPCGGIADFPAERAERGVELVSRFAGPVAFLAALGGIVWLIAG